MNNTTGRPLSSKHYTISAALWVSRTTNVLIRSLALATMHAIIDSLVPSPMPSFSSLAVR